MPRPSTTTVRDLRKSNRSRALWQVFLNGPLTRQEVGTVAGLSPATVSNLVAALVAEGVVVEVGLEDSNGGRPRGLLQVNPGYGYVIGVDVGETAFLVELFDFGLEPAGPARVGHRHVRAGSRGRGQPHRRGHRVGHRRGGGGARRASSASAWPCPAWSSTAATRSCTARASAGTRSRWRRCCADRTGLPILVDNGAKTLGQAERWFGAARGTDNAVIVLLGIGVGTCIISNGEVYRGATSSAGEWGHTTVCVGGRTCRCGADGCLEAYVGAGAIAARYEQLKRRRVDGQPRRAGRPGRRDHRRAGQRPGRRPGLDETITYLGAGIADLVNLFNPERVVVGGWLGRALGDDLLPRIREAAARRALHLPFSRVEIVTADLGQDAVALGGATLPIARLLTAGAVPPRHPEKPRRVRSVVSPG